MADIDRKGRIREYKQTRLPAGVYVVRNMRTGRSLVGSSPNLPGMLNRQRFQLEMGGHPDKELQADWNESESGVELYRQSLRGGGPASQRGPSS